MEPFGHGSRRGLPLGGRADAEIAPGVGAWCAPARTADPLGLGADERWFGSRKQVILASIVTNAEGSPRSRPRRPGACKPARTCGETSRPPLLIYFTYFVFARRTQDTSSSMMRRCSTPSRRRMWPPFCSSRRRRRTPSARTVGAGVGRGCGHAGGREGTRMRRAVAVERERTPEDIPIGYTIGYSTVRLCIVHPLS